MAQAATSFTLYGSVDAFFDKQPELCSGTTAIWLMQVFLDVSIMVVFPLLGVSLFELRMKQLYCESHGLHLQHWMIGRGLWASVLVLFALGAGLLVALWFILEALIPAHASCD